MTLDENPDFTRAEYIFTLQRRLPGALQLGDDVESLFTRKAVVNIFTPAIRLWVHHWTSVARQDCGQVMWLMHPALKIVLTLISLFRHVARS